MNNYEEKIPFKLGTILYHPVHGTPCCWEIKIEELKLTKKGWIINPDEHYIWGCGIPVNKMEEIGVYLDEDGSIQKAHRNEFYANQSKYMY